MFELLIAFYIFTLLAGVFVAAGLLVWMLYPDISQDFMDDWDQS